MIDWHARQRHCCSLCDVQYLTQKLPCPLAPTGEEARAVLLIGWGTAGVCLALTMPCNKGMSCQVWQAWTITMDVIQTLQWACA